MDDSSGGDMPSDDSSGGVDMKSLVQALSSDQKAQLLSLLVSGDQKPSGDKGMMPDKLSIEKGGIGPGEDEEIQEQLGGDHESEDDIADSMLSSSDKMRAARGDSPRNLSERMKFELAKKKQK